MSGTETKIKTEVGGKELVNVDNSESEPETSSAVCNVTPLLTSCVEINMEGSSSVFKPRAYKEGEDPETFMRGFMRVARANGWSDTQQRAIVPALFGESHEWLASELEEDASLTSMKEVKDRVMERLVPAEKRRTFLHQFYELKMSVSDEPRVFVGRLQALARAAMPDLGMEAQEQLVAEQITRAVPTQWRLRVLDSEATNTEALIRRLERIKTTEELQKGMVTTNMQVRTVSERRGPDRRACFKCGRQGHLAAACQTGSARDREAGLTCFRCGGRGHIQRQCPSQPGASTLRAETGGARPREGQEREAPRARPREGQEGEASRARLRGQEREAPRAVRRVDTDDPAEVKSVISLNGMKVQAVVDTGSTTSIISKEVAEDLGLELEEAAGTEDHFIAANGTRVATMGRCAVELQVGEVTLPHSFVVADLTDCVLIGMDVLQQLDAVISCRTGELAVAGKSIPRWSSASVRTRCKVTCAPRSETVLSIRRVTVANSRVFYPSEVEGVMIAPTVHLAHQAIPIRLLNLSEKEVEIPAGTVLGQDEAVDTEPCQTSKMECLPDVSHLSEPVRTQFQELLRRYEDVFSRNSEEVGAYTGPHQLVIDTGGARPVKQRAYRTPLHLREQLKAQLNQLEEQGLIEPSSSPWASPVVIVKKKDGGMRLCCDYRAVNQVIKHDSYPLPRMEDMLEATQGSTVFTVLDQRAAYWAVPVEEGSREVTAFTTEFGLHQWTRQPFGLKTSPATFQRIMEDLLKGMSWKQVMIYLDDVILFSKSTDQHLRDLEELLQKFRDGGLMLNPAKCQVAVTEVDFLGHHLSTKGIRPAEEKVEALRRWSSPRSVKELRRFLGFIGYYQQYIPDFGIKTAVMSDLLKKEAAFNWTEECEENFQLLKREMEEYPLLKFPDVMEEFTLTTDGSGTGWGAVLSQEKGVIAFASGKWTATEKNWSVTERELGAVIKAVNKFRHYLIGKPFKLKTDHEAIRFLQKSKPPSGRLYRWLEKLQEYDFTVEHVRGSSIPHVDALSRQEEQAETSKASKLNASAAEFVPQSGREHPLQLRRVTDPEESQDDRRRKASDEEQAEAVDVSSSSAVSSEGNAEFVEATAKDPVLRRLSLHLQGKELKTEDLTDIEVRELEFYSSLRGLSRKDGIILRKSKGHQKPQVLVPQSLRTKLLQMAHDIPTAGHGGVRRTVHRLMEDYFWYNMRLDVRKMCGSCQSCLAHKSKTTAHQEGRGAVPVEGQPLQQWAADIMELPRTEEGYRYVLVVTDLFSKMVELFALRNQTAEDVADCLMKVISRYGVMRSLLTDQGRNFESGLVRGLCERLKIKKLRTTVYRPCCNGVTERFNRTLCEMLSHFTAEEDWPGLLPLVASAYNSSTHSVTGFTPFELVHGFSPRTVLGAEFDGGQLQRRTYQRYLETLQSRLTDIHQLVSERVRQEQSRRTDTPETGGFKLGDTVWCRNFRAEKGVKGKLQPKFEGPYSVIRCRPPDYLLKKGRRRRWIHGAHLKRSDTRSSREVAVESESEAEEESISAGGRQRSGPVTTSSDLPWTETTAVAGERPWEATADMTAGRRQLTGATAGDMAAGRRQLTETDGDERQLAEAAADERRLDETTSGGPMATAGGQAVTATGGRPMTTTTGERSSETGEQHQQVGVERGHFLVAPSGSATVAPSSRLVGAPPGQSDSETDQAAVVTRCGREVRQPRRFLD